MTARTHAAPRRAPTSCTSAASTTRPRRTSSSGRSRAARACSPSRPIPSRRRRPSRTTRPSPRSRSCPLDRGVRLPLRRPLRPRPLCDPLARGAATRPRTTTPRSSAPTTPTGTATAAMPACRWTTMARDMRNRFLVALVFAIPIALWSPLGDRRPRRRPADAVRHRPRRLAVPAQPAGRSSTRPGSSSAAPGTPCGRGRST